MRCACRQAGEASSRAPTPPPVRLLRIDPAGKRRDAGACFPHLPCRFCAGHATPILANLSSFCLNSAYLQDTFWSPQKLCLELLLIASKYHRCRTKLTAICSANGLGTRCLLGFSRALTLRLENPPLLYQLFNVLKTFKLYI